ncbi:2-amino-4-hydroxy-6-hydroxymethyldihydropteridine diphosphokinase [Pseudohalioglobus lutimaris]|uniref:2-amino-4-hydroxy-6-hydroxymethyldihydropteridine pyrophosphokinase n=1 Tax=Pseudohalioglobus lutimaris TaxID=1737061 RepID=A0A2N5X0A0_9GAMM|nr:2-amino-4-hydroxy-6-hydroxymethyldihydropteridine diphosphokinase [Pseudohalioglobus lutimaris]PLW67914.1 2-amino-4-hydroxy-6-hydroxymethyldihydropteridine diphosphokinase [Pseudohalioglobus lutimaris]
MTTVYISLGSNLGKPLAQLQGAVRALDNLPSSTVTAVSSAWRSAAVGPGEQPDYLNGVVQLHTALAPRPLLDALQEIENQHGRERIVRWGARTLDLDILLYGQDQIADERLVIPHPRMTQRNFVLYPLLEVAPANLMLPGGEELGTLVGGCPPEDLEKTPFQLTPARWRGDDSRDRP